MKYSCDMVKDLLPLYHDEVCSEASRQIVEEHLEECEACKNIWQKMQDHSVDNCLQAERAHVVENHTKQVKRKSLTVGLCLSAVFMVPIVICLIVNLAVGRALDWFFIVLTALLVVASVTVVPLVLTEKRKLWTYLCFTGSLVLLLLTCALFTQGNWFWVAAVPTVFGLSVVGLPFVKNQIPLKGFLSRHKGLLLMIVDTLLLFAVLAVCAPYASADNYWQVALQIVGFCLIYPWGMFLIIRYVRTKGLIKAGICLIFSGIYFPQVNYVIDSILNEPARRGFENVNLWQWNDLTINANIHLLMLLSCVIIGVIFIIVGLSLVRKK